MQVYKYLEDKSQKAKGWSPDAEKPGADGQKLKWICLFARTAMQNIITLLCGILCIGAIICTPAPKNTGYEDEGPDNITEYLNMKIKSITDYQDKIATLDRTQLNLLVWSTQEVLDMLKGFQAESYRKILSQNKCPMPLIPSNGGLVCAYLHDIYYCKPMCAQGYDFSLLRLSRFYEECGSHTGFSWTTQYIGGNRLAECIESSIIVSGISTAYFTAEKCQQAITNTTSEQQYINTFLEELKQKDIKKEHKKQFDIVLCGE
ncbi:uncharacterized protein WCC33_011408 [Rhinophrynus dorsalis]